MLLARGRNIVPVTAFEVRTVWGARKITTMPFLFGAPPLEDSPETDCAWVETILELAKERRASAELKLRRRLPEAAVAAFRLRGARVSTVSRLALEPTYEEQYRAYPRNKREDIRKRNNALSRKNGLTLFESVSEHDMRQFHTCLQLVYQKKFGLPAHPWGLFKSIVREMGETGAYRLFGVRKEGALVGAVLFLRQRGNAEYAFGAVLPGFERFGLSSILIDRGIRWAIASGCTVCNFGGSHPEDENLLAFKARWGCRHEPVWWYRSADAAPPEPLRPSPLLSGIYRCLPAAITRPLLSLVVKQFG